MSYLRFFRLRVCHATMIALLFAGSTCAAQNVTVTGQVVIDAAPSKAKTLRFSNTVVWLTPLSPEADINENSKGKYKPLKLTQRNKSFEPHVLVVPVGAAVEFPNLDPWFHNVFSLFEGKRFDLGLYEAGESRIVHFDRVGISYIFCNIHPEMSAVVIAVRTPYYASADGSGNFTIVDVAPGRYTLHVWSEKALPEALQSATHEVRVAEGSGVIGQIHLPANSEPAPHKNKYGRDYDPQKSSDPAYGQR
jgi:plastocyanin